MRASVLATERAFSTLCDALRALKPLHKVGIPGLRPTRHLLEPAAAAQQRPQCPRPRYGSQGAQPESQLSAKIGGARGMIERSKRGEKRTKFLCILRNVTPSRR